MKSQHVGTNLREAAAGLLAGTTAGLVLGIGVYSAMYMVANAASFPSKANIEGVGGVLWVSVVIGATGGLLFAQLRHALPSSLWSGPLYGLSVMALLAPLFLPHLGHETQLLATPAQAVVVTASFGLAFYIYGLVLQALLPHMRYWRRLAKYDGDR